MLTQTSKSIGHEDEAEETQEHRIDFITSKYGYDVALERALEHHAKGEPVIVPIVVRNCLWQYTLLAKQQLAEE